MPLSLTTRRRQQTSSSTAAVAATVKWSSTQQHLRTDNAATSNANNLLRQHYLNQSVRKQKSFIEPASSHLIHKSLLTTQTERSYLSRGLSVGRSHDIQQRSALQRHLLKKHSTITGRNDRDSLKTGDLIKRNITNCGLTTTTSGTELLRSSRRLQAWSSTSSILKSLDKELAQLNGVVGKCKDVKVLKGRKTDVVDNVKG